MDTKAQDGIKNKAKKALQDFIYLSQSDTTAGFLSSNPARLNAIKSRPASQPVLIESASLSALKTLVRVPKIHKNRIRRAKFSTFIYPNGKAVRVIGADSTPKPMDRAESALHRRFLQDFDFLYSSSANPTGKDFELDFALQHCDVLVLDKRGLRQNAASKLYKINNAKIQRRR